MNVPSPEISSVSESEQTDALGASQPAPAQPVDLLVVGRGALARRVARLAAELGAHPVHLTPTLPGEPSPPAVDFPTLWRLACQHTQQPLDWPAMLTRARSVGVSPDSDARLAWPELSGPARFLAPDTIECGGRAIVFRRAVLAAGWSPEPLDAPGADECQYLTEDTLERLAELPTALAIIGAGPRACQWAQVFARLGSRVHLICPAGELLPHQPPEIAALLHAQLVSENVGLHLDTVPPLLERMGARKAVLLGVGDQQRKLLVDEVLYFGPHRSELATLDLFAAGIETRDDDQVLFDDTLRTTNPHVFLAGPLAPGEPLRFVDRSARVAMANARARIGWWPWAARLRLDLVPRCIHTQPQLVAVGLDPAAAAERPLQFGIYRADLHEEVLADEARPAAPGHLQLVLDRRSGLVAGATIVAHQAQPWLVPLAILMSRRLPLSALSDVFVCDASVLEPLELIARQAEADRRALYGQGWTAAFRARWSALRDLAGR